MRTEREKMLAGELYDPLDAELVEARLHACDLRALGDWAAIGAANVVTKDVLAEGNPCRWCEACSRKS